MPAAFLWRGSLFVSAPLNDIRSTITDIDSK
jgi:hypothetical protein